MFKACARCKNTIPLNQFRLRTNGRPGSYCIPCDKEKKALHYRANVDEIKARVSQWRLENRERYLDGSRSYYRTNRERYQRNAVAYRQKNQDQENARKTAWRLANLEKTRAVEQAYRDRNREACNERIAQWKKDNPHVRAEHSRRRQIAEERATPKWADRIKIMDVYRRAEELRRDTGETYHVDHIVPLHSPLVCGLHCEANLQILPAQENLKKNRYHWPDMP